MIHREPFRASRISMVMTRTAPLQAAAPVVPDSEHREPDAIPDVHLVARVRGGDVAAFELIMRRYNQRLFRTARAILRDAAEAEDVVQEAYVRAFEKLDTFNGPEGFAAWLSRIAANEALGRLRRRGRVIALDDHRGDPNEPGDRGVDAMPSTDLGPERLAASRELRAEIERAIDALPAEFRAVFVLRAVEGLSVAETAASLDIVEATVKTRLHRARRLLRQDLAARFDAAVPEAFAFAGARCDRIVAGVMKRLSDRSPDWRPNRRPS